MKLYPMRPDSPHSLIETSDGGPVWVDGDRDDQFDYNKSRPYDPGMTVAERVAAGYGSPEDCLQIESLNSSHREWRDSPEGKAWLEAQPWYNAPVKVKLLGWQEGLNGDGVMLYNRLDNGSTVTLESLRKEGVKFEVV